MELSSLDLKGAIVTIQTQKLRDYNNTYVNYQETWFRIVDNLVTEGKIMLTPAKWFEMQCTIQTTETQKIPAVQAMKYERSQTNMMSYVIDVNSIEIIEDHYTATFRDKKIKIYPPNSPNWIIRSLQLMNYEA